MSLVSTNAPSLQVINNLATLPLPVFEVVDVQVGTSDVEVFSDVEDLDQEEDTS